MSPVPGVDRFRVGFESTMRKHRTVDAADKEHSLFPADAVLARHSGKSRVHLSQAVRATAASGFVELNESVQTGLVVGCGPRRIPAPVQNYRKTLSFALAEIYDVPLFADLLEHLISGGGGMRLPGVKNPDAVFFGKRTRAANRAHVICSPTPSISRASPASIWSSSRSGLGITTGQPYQ
jgi:hypothetical protein